MVLHDIGASHYWGDSSTYATQLLLDVVVAEKYIMRDTDRTHGYPNIGAFIVNDDTRKYIEDCFHALTLPWQYIPDSQQLRLYGNVIKSHYSEELQSLYQMIVGLQLGIPNWSSDKSEYSYSVGELIHFTREANGTRYFKNGICTVESGFAWSLGNRALLHFSLTNSVEYIYIYIRFAYIFMNRQRLIARIGGKVVFSQVVEESLISFPIPQSLIEGTELEIELEYPDASSPSEKGVGDDNRVLAFAFQEIKLLQEGTSFEGTEPEN